MFSPRPVNFPLMPSLRPPQAVKKKTEIELGAENPAVLVQHARLGAMFSPRPANFPLMPSLRPPHAAARPSKKIDDGCRLMNAHAQRKEQSPQLSYLSPLRLLPPSMNICHFHFLKNNFD
jgi:hypothetical protein